ncbi:Bug family tripartite tricarboxylate transporter substrate binding protein [Xanthobacter aminoxidans]
MGRRFATLIAAGLCCVPAVLPAWAQGFPDRPVRIVVPFAPGGSTDVTARVLADDLSTTFKQQFIVENKPGAAGTTGIDLVAKAKPDGYIIGLSGVGPTAIIPMIDPRLPYDPVRDLDTIAALTAIDVVLVSRPDFGPKTLPELLAYAKANPGQVSYGSTGVAGPIHFGLENLARRAGVKMLHVPYAGDSQLITALLSGQIDIAFLTFAGGQGFVTSGKVHALAAGGPKRIATMPDLPTVAEITGFADYDCYTWNILVTAKGTPPDVLRKLNEAVNAALAKPQTRERFASLGLLILGGNVDDARRFVAAEIEKYRKIEAETGIRRE